MKFIKRWTGLYYFFGDSFEIGIRISESPQKNLIVDLNKKINLSKLNNQL